jgi:hypothetical protein
MELPAQLGKPHAKCGRIKELQRQFHPLQRTCLEKPAPLEIGSRLEGTEVPPLIIAGYHPGIRGGGVNHEIIPALVRGMAKREIRSQKNLTDAVTS